MTSTRLDPTALPEPFRAFATALCARNRPVEEFVHLLETMAPKAGARACVEFSEALRAAWPDHPLVYARTGTLLASSAPSYHIPMVADVPRNRAYADAIAAQIKPGMNVLEIGSGSGILAMLAARAGAAHVYTVEVNPTMAAIARRNVSLNGLDAWVTVIEANSLDLRVGDTLPIRCDALIHELFDSAGVADHMFEYLAHAQAQLLTKAPVLLPEHLEIWGQVDGAGRRAVALDDVSGLDLSALRLLDAGDELTGRNYQMEALSEAMQFAEIDLRSDFAPGQPIKVPVQITDTGDVRGLVQWIGFRFPDGTVYRNPPGVPSHWSMVRTRFARPPAVRPGETRCLTVHIGMHYLWYEFA